MSLGSLFLLSPSLFLLLGSVLALVHKGEATLATILPVKVRSHEYPRTTFFPRALPLEPLDFP